MWEPCQDLWLEIKNILKHLRYMGGTYFNVGGGGEERIWEKPNNMPFKMSFIMNQHIT